jgi:hypothetical protein
MIEQLASWIKQMMDTFLKSNQAFGIPFTLFSSSIKSPLSSAIIESNKPVHQKIVLATTWLSIYRAIFKQLYPNLDCNPIVVIQHIHQVSKDNKKLEVQQLVV